MERILVIGGGPAGLMASICASDENREVTLMERNLKCGKKLLLTGNGHCNYWNKDSSISHFHSDNKSMLSKIITEHNLKKTWEYLSSFGIIPLDKNGYLYPSSNQSNTMLQVLLMECREKKVKIFYDSYVEKIIKREDVFEVFVNDHIEHYDKVIIATGSMSYSKTGSDGNGYELSSKLGHAIIEIEPSLVALYIKFPYLKDWHGIRTQAVVSLWEDDICIKKEEGELQLTKEGVSGICVFNISREASRGIHNYKKEEIIINFLPFLITTWEEFMKKGNKTVGETLECVLHYELVNILLRYANVSYHKYYKELTTEEKIQLETTFTALKLSIIGTKSFQEAQVCSGGVSLGEINPETLESLKVKGLFFTGELLDIDGDCGGYNLMNAFTTGMVAGEGTKSK